MEAGYGSLHFDHDDAEQHPDQAQFRSDAHLAKGVGNRRARSGPTGKQSYALHPRRRYRVFARGDAVGYRHGSHTLSRPTRAPTRGTRFNTKARSNGTITWGAYMSPICTCSRMAHDPLLLYERGAPDFDKPPLQPRSSAKKVSHDGGNHVEGAGDLRDLSDQERSASWRG